METRNSEHQENGLHLFQFQKNSSGVDVIWRKKIEKVDWPC